MQTFPNWEGVCVDDGSCDESGEILDSVVRRDGRFRVIHQRNNGASSARNRALTRVKGSWISFLDADDVWRYDCLQLLDQAIQTTPETELILFKHINDVTFPMDGYKIKQIDCHAIFPHALFCPNFCDCAYRATLVKNVRFPDFIHSEDVYFLAHARSSAKIAVSLDCTLYGYRAREGSAVHSPLTLQKLTDSFFAWSGIWKHFNTIRKSVERAVLRDVERYLLLQTLTRLHQLHSSKSARLSFEHAFYHTLGDLRKLPLSSCGFRLFSWLVIYTRCWKLGYTAIAIGTWIKRKFRHLLSLN